MYQAIVLFPLIGFLIVGLLGKDLGPKASGIIASGLIIFCSLLAWTAYFKYDAAAISNNSIDLINWINVGALNVKWSIKVDTMSLLMFVVVTTVSAIVHIYSIGYMSDDPSISRFFAYLSFFTFTMLVLVSSNNLVQMFLGWEGVGLASYLLIGFWYHKASANDAAVKAFVVNRVGDFGFILGICLIYALVGSVDFSALNNVCLVEKFFIAGFEFTSAGAISLSCLLLFCGAMGKSAQFLLHTWLPDAMEGPTPVSALIHAATMVTAGVFMVARLSPLFELAPGVLEFITIIGAITAFFAASVGLVQNDIKRVIAYSTCSQLGYMFVALGVGAYSGAMFHLFTHAFFKALLFLGAGSVIHAVSGNQDMRTMGGLNFKVKNTYYLMLLGVLALTGVGIPFTHIGFAGFQSKDYIIESAFAAGTFSSQLAFISLVLAAAMTSFYSWRLIFMTFFGKFRGSEIEKQHIHESPDIMLIPLLILAAGAIFAGGFFRYSFVGNGMESFWGDSIFIAEEVKEHHIPFWVIISPFVAMLSGFILAFLFYVRYKDIPKSLKQSQSILYNFLLNAWYFDKVYNFIFVVPLRYASKFAWIIVDKKLIDGLGPNGVAKLTEIGSKRFSRFQTGFVFHYALAILLGLVILLSLIFINGGNT